MSKFNKTISTLTTLRGRIQRWHDEGQAKLTIDKLDRQYNLGNGGRLIDSTRDWYLKETAQYATELEALITAIDALKNIK
jgi:hypothetical protein